MNEIYVRPAEKSDAQGILEAHYSAVHEVAAKDYPVEILDEWSGPVNGDRIERYLKESLSNETTLVALIDGKIVGFGAIVASVNELRAVYVSANSIRRGVGIALLRGLEELARERGCLELLMDSSLTAVPFYREAGYKEIGRGHHSLRSGRQMACVKMRKTLV